MTTFTELVDIFLLLETMFFEKMKCFSKIALMTGRDVSWIYG